MNVNKQLINLAGILAVTVILLGGLALVALPMFSQTQATDAQTRNVAQTNATYQAQIDALSSAEEHSDEIDMSLTGLRAQIAAAPKLDDVFEIVAKAAEANQATIESIVAADPTAFAARPGVIDVGGLGRPTPAPEPMTAPAETTATSTEASDAADTSADSTTDASATDSAATDAEASGPQQEVLVTITVSVPDAKTAAAFIDALRVGPRLILPTENAPAAEAETDPAAARAAATAQAQKAAALVDDLGGGPRLLAPINVDYTGGKLTISILTFIRTEDAQ